MTRRNPVQIAKPPVTWILVADSRQAQGYTRHAVEKLVPLAGNSRRGRFEEVIAHAPVPVDGMRWKAESPGEYETVEGANTGNQYIRLPSGKVMVAWAEALPGVMGLGVKLHCAPEGSPAARS